jgi:hypothetical protein
MCRDRDGVGDSNGDGDGVAGRVGNDNDHDKKDDYDDGRKSGGVS